MIGKKIIGIELDRPGSTPPQVRNNGLSQARNNEKLGDTKKESTREKRDSLLKTIKQKTTGGELDPDRNTLPNLSMSRSNFKSNGSVSREESSSLENQLAANVGKAKQFFEIFEKSYEETNLMAHKSKAEPFVSADTDIGREALAIQESMRSSRFSPDNLFLKDDSVKPFEYFDKKSGR